MLPKTSQEIQNGVSAVCNFYAGKTILITGAAGFLGTILLEALLRCCPDISRIYIVLRPKKGLQAEERKNLIFEKDIFIKLRATNPDAFTKVTALSGDTSQDNLGLNENDYTKLTKEVSIVFHMAAIIAFTKPLSFIVNQNVISVCHILQLCRQLKDLQVLVYTSSAFSNCNQKDVIEEKIYDLPFSLEDVIEYGRSNNEDELKKIYQMCKPRFPNSYAFSKCVAENLLKETANDLPVCIMRPSIIINCLRGSLPGYVEKGTAVVNLPIAVGRGYVHVARMDMQKRIEIMPADMVANAHIVAGFHHASKSLPSPSVFNCVTGEERVFTWNDYIQNLLITGKKHPLPHSYICPMFICTKSETVYNLLSFFLHYIPAAIFDLLFWISGSKIRLLKLCKFYDAAMREVAFFTLHDWDMRNRNFLSLSKGLSELEKKLFFLEPKDITSEEIIRGIPTGCYAYQLNGKLYVENFRWKCLRYFLTSLIICFVLGIIAMIFYTLFVKSIW